MKFPFLKKKENQFSAVFASFLLLGFVSGQTTAASTLATSSSVSVVNPITSTVPSTLASIPSSSTSANLDASSTVQRSSTLSASSSTSVAPNGVTTVFIVTVFQSAAPTSSSTPSPSSTSDPNSSSNQDSNTSSNTSMILWIFLGLIGCVIVAASAIYVFRFFSLRASPSFRKRLSNEDCLSEASNSQYSPTKDSLADRAVYPPQQQFYPSTLRPIRYNVSSSTLGSLSSQPGAGNVVIGYPAQQMSQHVYPSYTSVSTIPPVDGLESQQNVPGVYYPFEHGALQHDATQVAYYDEQVPVTYEDGTVGYVAHSQIVDPSVYYYAEPVPAHPVIVRVGSTGSNLYHQGYDGNNDQFPDASHATLDPPNTQ